MAGTETEGAPAAAEEFAFVPVEDPTDYAHGAPTDGMECMATMEDITEEDKNYCEFQTMPSGKWHPALYSSEVVKRLIKTQFADYVAGVRKADCAADLKRRLNKGPPIWVEDKHALPVPEEDTHICRVWFAEEGKEYSAKLKDCVEVRCHCAPSRCISLPPTHRVCSRAPLFGPGRGARRTVGGAQEVHASRCADRRRGGHRTCR